MNRDAKAAWEWPVGRDEMGICVQIVQCTGPTKPSEGRVEETGSLKMCY